LDKEVEPFDFINPLDQCVSLVAALISADIVQSTFPKTEVSLSEVCRDPASAALTGMTTRPVKQEDSQTQGRLNEAAGAADAARGVMAAAAG
jgi:hypothetical protein